MNELFTVSAVVASALLWTAAAVAWAARRGAFASARRDWRASPRLRKALACVALAAAAAWAGTKPEVRPSADLRGVGEGLSSDDAD